MTEGRRMTWREFFRPMFPALIKPVAISALIEDAEYEAKRKFLERSVDAIRARNMAAAEEEVAQFLEHYKNT